MTVCFIFFISSVFSISLNAILYNTKLYNNNLSWSTGLNADLLGCVTGYNATLQLFFLLLLVRAAAIVNVRLSVCVCLYATLMLNILETKRFRGSSNRVPIGKCLRHVDWCVIDDIT